MTKSLTEQWKDGELENGMFYLVVKDEEGVYVTVDTHSRMFNVWGIVRDKDIKEVLAPVPDFNHFSQLVKKVEKLERQLKEANELIKDYGDEYPVVVKDYLEKWGVK